jgi:hypothetical protein
MKTGEQKKVPKFGDLDETIPMKLSRDQLQTIMNQVDAMHLEGKTITNAMLASFIHQEWGIQLSRPVFSSNALATGKMS